MNNIQLSAEQIAEFQQNVLAKGKELYREMPWRSDTTPYSILLSEIMLQQTQVPRVMQKYSEFMSAFPTLESLAEADFQEVLAHWSGLGYNRRARFLHQTAQKIVQNGTFPETEEFLRSCPGIGENTAASILVYTFNKPLVFLETNVRTVLIYTFLSDYIGEKIEESVLKDLAKQTLFAENPRQWYWALMDYGTYLKKTEGNFNRMSKMHTVQSRFEGSFRQKRASVLRCLLKNGPLTVSEIAALHNYDVELTGQIVFALQKDSMVAEIEGRIVIQ
ncbi:MAG: hypothetical protein MJ198_08015 [Bacteroidales bacterium]|nr:hypothetical protein [Bacteroidales bacterium]